MPVSDSADGPLQGHALPTTCERSPVSAASPAKVAGYALLASAVSAEDPFDTPRGRRYHSLSETFRSERIEAKGRWPIGICLLVIGVLSAGLWAILWSGGPAVLHVAIQLAF